MSEQTKARSESETTEILETEPLLTDGDWPEAEHAPITRRRGLTGLPTPFRVGLLCLLIAVVGFISGALIEKGSGGGGSTSASPFGSGGLPSFLSGGPGSGNSTMGTVATVAGGTLYVTDAQGKTVKVLTSSETKVTRSTGAKAHDIHPGDSVVIQGATRKSGTVEAQSINATASGTSIAGTAAGGGATGGSSGSSGSSAVNQLFGN